MLNDVNSVKRDGGVDATTEDFCEWIVRKLIKEQRVTGADFISHFSGLVRKRKKSQASWDSDWSRAKHATMGCLRPLGVSIQELDNDLALLVPFEGVTSKSGSFKPDHDSVAKQKIAKTVATFLDGKRTSVFLGSGSTVFHIASAMKKGGEYKQLFWTVNIALAAALCGMDSPPIAKISIPEAVLETHSFRFATMQEPGWAPAMVVVGADGWRFDNEKNEVYFYGNEQSVADNTNLFVKNATHSVIYCLDGLKIEAGLDPHPNSGPRIHSPRKGVLRILVTNVPPSAQVQGYFKSDGWFIVADISDWEKVEEQLKPAVALKKSGKLADSSLKAKESKLVETTIAKT